MEEKGIERLSILLGNDYYNSALKFIEEAEWTVALEKAIESKSFYEKAKSDRDIKNCQWLIDFILSHISEKETDKENAGEHNVGC